MKRFIITVALLGGLLLAACLSTPTPRPAPTLTPGLAPTAAPTPGNLDVKVVETDDSAMQNLRWQEIPVVNVETTSKIGLEVISNGWKIWLHKPDDTTMGNHHIHAYIGGVYVSGSVYHSDINPNQDEFKIQMGWQYTPIKVTETQVLKVGTVNGFVLYLRRVPGQDRWQVAVP